MLRLAKVVNVNPQAHSADVVFMDTGDRVPNVQVQSANISTNSGKLGLHLPTAPPTPYGVQDTGERDVFAWVDFAGSIPVITGFKVPEIGQMTFLESNLEVDRHASDFYRTVSDDGSVEMAWPNGLWMGVQTTPGHVDRTGTDYDGQWKIARNTGASYTTTLGLPDGVGTIQISPAGALTITLAGAATLQAASWTFKGPATFTDAMTVQSTITATGDVSAAGISLDHHVHTEVESGTANSGPPAS